MRGVDCYDCAGANNLLTPAKAEAGADVGGVVKGVDYRRRPLRVRQAKTEEEFRCLLRITLFSGNLRHQSSGWRCATASALIRIRPNAARPLYNTFTPGAAGLQLSAFSP